MKPWIAIFAALLVSPGLASAQDIPLSQILVDKQGWREVAKDLPKVTFLEGEPDGSLVLHQTVPKYRLSAAGALEKLPIPEAKQGEKSAQRVLTSSGKAYEIVASLESRQSKRNVTAGKAPLLLPGLTDPSCLTLWPDEGQLVVGESDGAYLWAVRIEADGTLGPGDRYYSLRTVPDRKMHVTALTMDAKYLLYACTPLGVQVFDPTGRLSGVITAPARETMTAIAIGGAKGDTLFVACGERIFARPIQGKASYTLEKAK